MIFYFKSAFFVYLVSRKYKPFRIRITIKGFIRELVIVESKGIGREIEGFCTDLDKKRNCDRIEVHCHSRRIDTHRFYSRQGFTESPKYFIKMINESV